MSAPQNEYERYLELADREACDEPLSPDERAFCRAFEQRHAPRVNALNQSGEITTGGNPLARQELAMYAELSNMSPPPDAASRALVDRALARFHVENAEQDAERAKLESERHAHHAHHAGHPDTDEQHEIKLLRRSGRPGWGAWVTVAGFALGALYAVLDRTAGTGLHGTASAPLARAELVYASGSVKVSDANGSASRTLLSAGSVIETQSGGACVLIDNDINVCLGSQSRMRLTNIAGPARVIDLESGKLATRLSTQPEGMSLSIVASGVASTAVGTAYSVERTSSDKIVTTVLNGKVRVGHVAHTANAGRANAGQGDDDAASAVFVNAHERSVVSASAHGPTARPTVTSVRRTEEAPSWALLGPTVLWHDPVAATLEVHGEPAGAEAWLDEQWLGTTPISSLIPVGEHRLVVRKDDRELLTRDLHVHAGDAQDIRYEPAQAAPTAQLRVPEDERPAGAHPRKRSNRELRGASHAARSNRGEAGEHGEYDTDALEQERAQEPESGAELLRQARQAVRAGQFRGAATVYEKLIDAHGGSEEALAALVALGQLRLNQLGDPRGALKPLDGYLRHGGALEEVARVTRIDALQKLHRDADERSAIEDFLHRYPRSFETKRLRARLDSLQQSALSTAP